MVSEGKGLVIPEWLTLEQVNSIHALYERNPDGAADKQEFFDRVQSCIGDYAGLNWCGMFIGIEKNGYAHS